MSKRTPFQILSNLISTASDTGDVETLHECDKRIAVLLADGQINLPQAGELTADCEAGLEALGRDEYVSNYYRAEQNERSLDELENA